MNLVVRHKFYGCVGENTEECCRMTLEESTKPAISIDFEASTKSTTPGSYNIIRIFHVRSGYNIPTCILLKVWVGGLKKDLDSVKRSDNCFGLRLKGVKTGKVSMRGRKTYDTPGNSTSQTRADDVVKRFLFWLGGCSIGTHSQRQEIIKVIYESAMTFRSVRRLS